MSQRYTCEGQRGQVANEGLNQEHNKDQLFPLSPLSEISNFIILCHLRGNLVATATGKLGSISNSDNAPYIGGLCVMFPMKSAILFHLPNTRGGGGGGGVDTFCAVGLKVCYRSGKVRVQ
jgi:hypothetical protein